MKKILVIEDDPAIRKGLEESLRGGEYDIILSEDGIDGYMKARRGGIDVIILDLGLPGRSGIDVCRDLRKENILTPILMLTCRSEEIDKVLGLELGADDYMTKPFSIRELQARIKALLRRKNGEPHAPDELSFGRVKIDFKKLEASKAGKSLALSAMEFKILKYLARHEGEVVTREMLLDEVWGFEIYPTTRTVDNFILSLRKHLEDNRAKPKHILTVFKAGYKFVK
ncbi:MAG: response regulator transcription factor [Acidobacteriota bacterium]